MIPPELILQTTAGTKISFLLFLLAKLSGIMGVCLGFTPFRFWGGFLLCVAAISLLSIAIISFFEMSKQNSQENKDIEVIKRMLAEGTLSDSLKKVGFR